MVTPNLHDIFFGNDFTGDTIPELKEAQNKYEAAIEKVALAYNMPFSDSDALRCASTGEAIMSQYLGFVQGFQFAVKLLVTGGQI